MPAKLLYYNILIYYLYCCIPVVSYDKAFLKLFQLGIFPLPEQHSIRKPLVNVNEERKGWNLGIIWENKIFKRKSRAILLYVCGMYSNKYPGALI